ncbi:hypothetical protein [Campylobacter troglodytis]|nr:hypothetical protein [Campylobacter troglodytis]
MPEFFRKFTKNSRNFMKLAVDTSPFYERLSMTDICHSEWSA